MMAVTQQISLEEQLRRFARRHREVECCAVISTTGIMLASYHIDHAAEDKFAAICTANFGLLSRSSRELGGKMQHFTVQINGKDGTTILSGDGRRIVFIALGTEEVKPRDYLLSEIKKLLCDDD
jgi:predicted regulator of Ras-like GTPase activity (Roadblock/LC7/MglB family)